jgi:DNA-binding transcriptional ArsR family regulator
MINATVAMSTLGPKQALFAQFAAIAKTLGNGHRLELLEQLAQGERTVEVLASRTDLSIANASQHLQHLRRAGLLTARRQGKFVYYTLADDGILDVLTALRRIAERNVAEVERVVRSYFNKLDDLEPVTRKQLLKLIRQGAVTVLDVRPPDEFALGHVPGAVNIPLRALKERLAEINPDREKAKSRRWIAPSHGCR